MKTIELYLTEDKLHYKDLEGKLWLQTINEDNPKLPVFKHEEMSVEGLAEKELVKINTKVHKDLERDGWIKTGFIRGYNQAKSSDKKYTEEDLWYAFEYGKEFSVEDFGSKYFEEFIQSLNQRKLPETIQVELEEVPYNTDCKKGETNFNVVRIKSTTPTFIKTKI